jgi:hypothetical protein
VFEARIDAGKPSPSDDETRAVGWFGPDELDRLEFAPSTRETLRCLLAGRGFH